MRNFVMEDCQKIEASLTEEVENLERCFLTPDYMGDRGALVAEITEKKQQLETVRALSLRAMVM